MRSPITRSVSNYPIVDKYNKIVGNAYGDKALEDLEQGQYHRGVHVFVESFGGFFIAQKFEGVLTSSAFGHMLTYETPLDAAQRIVDETLGIRIESQDLELVTSLPPCEESQGEIINFYSYLLDLDREIIKAHRDIEKLIICKLAVIIKDLYQNPKNYNFIFPTLMNAFLTMYRN